MEIENKKQKKVKKCILITQEQSDLIDKLAKASKRNRTMQLEFIIDDWAQLNSDVQQ